MTFYYWALHGDFLSLLTVGPERLSGPSLPLGEPRNTFVGSPVHSLLQAVLGEPMLGPEPCRRRRWTWPNSYTPRTLQGCR